MRKPRSREQAKIAMRKWRAKRKKPRPKDLQKVHTLVYGLEDTMWKFYGAKLEGGVL